MIISDVIDATKIRLRAPYFGYAALAFVGFNWKSIFLLCLTDGTPIERIAAFDSATSAYRLVLFPLLVGIVVAATSEWARLLFNALSSYPAEKIVNMQLTSEHRRLLKVAELESARSKLMEARETEIIRRAKQDEAVAAIVDEDTKKRLLAQLSAYRRDEDVKGEYAEPISENAAELLRNLAESRSGEVRTLSHMDGDLILVGKLQVDSSVDPRKHARLTEGLAELLARGLFQARHTSSSGTAYLLTSAGWEEADRISKDDN